MKNILFIIIYLLCFPVFSQNKEDIEKLKEIIYTLSADSMMGRAAGSAGEEKAKIFLAGYFKEIGIRPLKDSYFQEFVFPKDSIQTDTAYNLTGIIDNKADSTIIIGAHYDHLGYGGPKSRSLTSTKIHPGADDNASGVALMLAIAEHLKKSGSKKFNYLFIAFSAHEDGLYGSKAFVKDSICDFSKVKFMLNFDMVGRLDTNSMILRIIRDDNYSEIDSLLFKVKPEKLNLRINSENKDFTDASAFYSFGISSLSFTTGSHDDYHKTSDTADKINYKGMYLILQYIKDFITALNQ